MEITESNIQTIKLELESYFQEYAEQQQVPGLVFCLTNPQKTLFSIAHGMANIATGVPMQPHKKYFAASVGKTFTAILMLLLEDQNLIDIQKPITEYLPSLQMSGDLADITIHHLLSHTSGLVTGTGFAPNSPYEVYHLNEIQMHGKPGVRFHYSNVGYRILGYLAERVTGEPYSELIDRLIIKPLDLQHTAPVMSYRNIQEMAIGYDFLGTGRPYNLKLGYKEAPLWETNAAEGSIVTTASDMAIFVRMMMNRGIHNQVTIIPENAYQKMSTVQTPQDDIDYGYGLRVVITDEHSLILHGGGAPGFCGYYAIDTKNDFGAIIWSNSPFLLAESPTGLMSYIAEACRSNEEKEITPYHVFTDPNPMVVEDSDRFIGTYTGDNQSLVIEAQENRLFVRIGQGDQVPLENRLFNRFYLDHPDFEDYLLEFYQVEPLIDIPKEVENAEHTAGDCDGTTDPSYTNENSQPVDNDVDAVADQPPENQEMVCVYHGGDVYYKQGIEPPYQPTSIPEEWKCLIGRYKSYKPWASSFQIVLRQDRLLVYWPDGSVEYLIQTDRSRFFYLNTPDSPEWLEITPPVDGQVLKVMYSQCPYYFYAL